VTGPVLQRRIGLRDAVLIGLGSMIGAGVFAAPGPAVAAAGTWLPLCVLLAGAVAWCNATSSARLAAVHPQAGGTYAYATLRLGPAWGHLAGWSFLVGKTASCAAMAITAGAYAWPSNPRAAALAVLAVTVALGTGGVVRGLRLTRVLVALALVALAVVVAAGLAAGPAAPSAPAGSADGVPLRGVLEGAGLMFFAFAGYARITTLGEEVVDPARTIRRAVARSLAAVVLLYLVVTGVALHTLGPQGLAGAVAPLAEVVAAAGWEQAGPVVRVGAVAASTGALLALLLGVSRTAFAMARDGHLPGPLVGVRRGVPHRAELAVGAVVAVLVLVGDLRGAIGFSSFGVLVYYLLAQLSARRLGPGEGAPPRWWAASAARCSPSRWVRRPSAGASRCSWRVPSWDG
jgi:APA family basic amino acid/polyamine antiporter